MKATIKDVAKEAKVSPSTVSRVLSNNPKISEKTKEKVNEAIKKLKYSPNAIARSLANNKTRTIGIVLPNESDDLFSNPFFIQAMKGISIYAKQNNYYIMYTFSKKEEEEYNYIKNFIKSGVVDGICLLTSRSKDKCIEYLKSEEFPFCIIGRPESVKDTLWVDNDNFKAMYDVVNKLIAKGHKNIGFVGAKREWNVSKDRLSGYKQALSINGIKLKKEHIVEIEEFSEKAGYEGAKLIKNIENLTAIVATDDLIAFGVNKMLKEKGLDNVSLVGFNNIPLSEYQNPPLSSVNINAEKLGYYASKLLIDRLENKEKSTINHYIVDTNLIERASLK